jgi:hypothetical protein
MVKKQSIAQKIISIRRIDPRPPRCAQALALMVEAQALLVGLVERDEVPEGSPPEATLYYLDDAIGMLTPDEEVAP